MDLASSTLSARVLSLAAGAFAFSFMFAALFPGSIGAQEDKTTGGTDETIVLFDGSNLDHWRGYSQEEIGAGWKIEGDVLKFDGSGGGDIVTREAFSNFELSFEWAVTAGANSGVMYRVGMGDAAPYVTGPEFQILDNERHADGKNPLTSAASLYALYAPEEGQTRPIGEWNQSKIVVQGNRVEHWLNGTRVVEADLSSDDWKERLGKSKFKDWEKFATLSSGHIALQDHGDEVSFRNITIRRMDSETDDK